MQNLDNELTRLNERESDMQKQHDVLQKDYEQATALVSDTTVAVVRLNSNA